LPAAAEKRHNQFLQRALPLHRFSAGSQPTGRVNANALKQLVAAHLPTAGLHSKSWDEFAAPGAPEMDFVFTVCDSAAKEPCPLWPGCPVTAHWSVADPAAVEGTPETVERGFRDAYFTLEKRIELFLSLPHQSLDALELKARCAEIGAA